MVKRAKINLQTLFEHDDYKIYVSHHPRYAVRGGPSALAKHLKCQPAYIHKIFHSDSHLSLEQAERMNQFFGHGPNEGHFFLLLVQHARAGTQALAQYFRRQMDQCRKEENKLSRRVDQNTLQKLDPHAEALYYSDWHYAAILMILTMPAYRSVSKISGALRCHSNLVTKFLVDLTEMGLVKQESVGVFVPLRSNLYLPQDSPHLRRHHLNCRGKVLEQLLCSGYGEESQDLHYSSVFTLSVDDAYEVRKAIVACIEAIRARVKPSPEETMQLLTIDYFPCLRS